jgi:molybdopterin converting factor small subunit
MTEKTIQLTIEFTGVAKQFTGVPSVDFVFPEDVTYKDVVRALGERYPELIGLLIDQDGETFLSSNMFIINNEMALPVMVMDEHPNDGDRLVLVSIMTGG